MAILARFERAAFRLGVQKGDSPRSPLLAFQCPKALDFTGFLTNVFVRITEQNTLQIRYCC